MKDTPIIIAKGVCMGAADVVPGVSGGTMALVLGIYQRLLSALRNFDLEFLACLGRGQWRAAAARVDLVFLLPLAVGIATALWFFTRVVPIPKLLVTHPEPIYALFFGLIVASIIVLLRDLPKLSVADSGWLILGLLSGLLLVTRVPLETPNAAWFIFCSGAIAISAMLLPGISGSFILLLLRKYAYVFDAIGHLKFAVVIPFALGAVTGLLVFSRVLTWLLRRWHRQTLLTITGLLLGSLWMIWPFQERTFDIVRGKSRLVHSAPLWPEALDGTVVAALGCALLGLILVLGIHRLAQKNTSLD